MRLVITFDPDRIVVNENGVLEFEISNPVHNGDTGINLMILDDGVTLTKKSLALGRQGGIYFRNIPVRNRQKYDAAQMYQLFLQMYSEVNSPIGAKELASWLGEGPGYANRISAMLVELKAKGVLRRAVGVRMRGKYIPSKQ